MRSGGSPTLTDVTFSGNTADEGGGMATGGEATLIEVTFFDNTAHDIGGGHVLMQQAKTVSYLAVPEPGTLPVHVAHQCVHAGVEPEGVIPLDGTLPYDATILVRYGVDAQVLGYLLAQPLDRRQVRLVEGIVDGVDPDVDPFGVHEAHVVL